MHPDSKWAYVAKHVETLSKDPLRPKSGAWHENVRRRGGVGGLLVVLHVCYVGVVCG